MTHRKKKGFTLIELIVVLAVLAIIAAIAVPKAFGSIEKARAAACAQNIASVRSQWRVFYAAAYAKAPVDSAACQTLLDEAVAELAPHCPSGGTYTFTAAEDDNHVMQITGTCSKHGEGVGVYSSLGDSATMDALKDIAASSSGSHVVSSQGMLYSPTGLARDVVAALAQQGIDLNAMGAATWYYDPTANGNNGVFFWSPADISGNVPGDTVPMMRYNFKTGTYTVWEIKLASKTVGNVTYTDYGTSGKLLSTVSNAADQTYEQALADYNKVAG